MQNDKNNLFSQLGYFDISTFRGKIRDNDNITLCLHLGYFHKSILQGQLVLYDKTIQCR